MDEINIFIKRKNKHKHKSSENQNNDKNMANNSRNISYILIYIFLIIIFFWFVFKFFYREREDNSGDINILFEDILPKISSNNKKIKHLKDIFNSRQLFISESNLTLDYIHYIRPIDENEEKKYKENLFSDISPELSFTENRKDQIDLHTFYNLNNDEKLISNETIEYNDKPIISVLVPSYNKAEIIIKSIRSIQNQSFKNIEIIIVDDCSTDNSSTIFKYLLETDPRIRIFTHLKNMGAWRSRLDAFLYSKAPYVIHFDAGDFYTDNFVLEDAYSLITKYNLDSVRFSFKLSRSKEDIDYRSWNFSFHEKDRKIVYGTKVYNMLLYAYGPIWNRLTRANIFTKGMDFLDEYILNAYKNLYEDRWWNTLANNASYSYLMVNRVGYIYLRIPGGEGTIRYGNKILNEKTIKEFIYFWLFDYLLLGMENNKKSVIDNLHKYKHKTKGHKLKDLTSYFRPYIHLLDLLINDIYVREKDKKFIKHLKSDYLQNLEYNNIK